VLIMAATPSYRQMVARDRATRHSRDAEDEQDEVNPPVDWVDGFLRGMTDAATAFVRRVRHPLHPARH
jgi:hypothetical protein